MNRLQLHHHKVFAVFQGVKLKNSSFILSPEPNAVHKSDLYISLDFGLAMEGYLGQSSSPHRLLDQRILDHLLRINPVSILDIGCADGKLLKLIQNNISTVNKMAGMDINPHLVKLAQSQLSSTEFLVGDISDLLIKPMGKFEVIIASCLVMHLNSSALNRALYQIENLLEMNGTFIVVTVAWPWVSKHYQLSYIGEGMFQTEKTYQGYKWNEYYLRPGILAERISAIGLKLHSREEIFISDSPLLEPRYKREVGSKIFEIELFR